MDKESLRQFLIDSNKAGYADGEGKKWVKEPDGSTTIPFEKAGLQTTFDHEGITGRGLYIGVKPS